MLYATMEYIVFAVILYFILQTAGNLVLIVRGKSNTPKPTMPDGWEGPHPRRYTGRTRNHPRFWSEDVQRAHWVDLEDADLEDDATD